MIYIIIGIALYFIIGILYFGMCFAYWQRKFPYTAKIEYKNDKRWSIFCSILWPFSWIHYVENKFWKYGFKFK